MKAKSKELFFQDKIFSAFLVAAPDDAERDALLKQKLSQISESFALLSFSVENLELKNLFEHLETASLFGGPPVAILDHAEKLTKKELEALKEFGKNFPKNSYLLLGACGKCSLIDEEWLLALDLLSEKPWDREKRLKERLFEMVRKNGKTIVVQAIDCLVENNEFDGALLEQEIEKLICYTGERKTISLEDVEKICSQNKSQSIWQEAEKIVWEGSVGGSDPFALFPMIRSQLEMGLKIALLIEESRPKEEWNQHLPKMYPRLLEKRAPQAAKLGSVYFSKGLKILFDLELLSRSGSESPSALLTLLQVKLGNR